MCIRDSGRRAWHRTNVTTGSAHHSRTACWAQPRDSHPPSSRHGAGAAASSSITSQASAPGGSRRGSAWPHRDGYGKTARSSGTRDPGRATIPPQRRWRRCLSSAQRSRRRAEDRTNPAAATLSEVRGRGKGTPDITVGDRPRRQHQKSFPRQRLQTRRGPRAPARTGARYNSARPQQGWSAPSGRVGGSLASRARSEAAGCPHRQR